MLAGPNFVKIMRENEDLKEEVRRMQELINKGELTNYKKLTY